MSPDDAHLLDMLIAARELREIARGTNPQLFDASRVHQLAFMKLLQLERIVPPETP